MEWSGDACVAHGGQVALAIEMGATYGCVEWGRSRIWGMMKAALPWPLRDLGGIVANTTKMRYNAPQIDSIIFFAT